MTHRFHALLLVLSLAAIPAFAARPWWDDYPTTVQPDRASTARESRAAVVIHGCASDPTWGILGAALRRAEFLNDLRRVQSAGMKAITWVEAFGDCMCYAAALGLSPSGSIARSPADRRLPQVLLNQWAWELSGGLPPNRKVWTGLHNYTDDLPWARPFTRTHPRYGAPIPRFPDRTPALGWQGDPLNPSNWRVYHATGAKDINGRLRAAWELNPKVNEIDPYTGQPKGPTDGLVPVVWGRDEIAGVQGLKPADIRYAGIASIHKDSACPFWPQYFAASCRFIADSGLNGLWCDNYSAFDSFGYPPVERAFGEWSVARFRSYLKRNFTPAELTRMGVDDVSTFDVREGLKNRFRHWFASDPSNLNHPGWRDRRWLSDPLWKAYREFKRQIGAQALHRCYQAAKRIGGEDFLVSGNDIPWFSLGWVTPRWLDMVSTEVTPGWHMGTGSFGVGFPPVGRMSPTYRLATAHSQGRFAVAWYYLDGDYARYRGSTEVGKVLSFEALACNTFLLSYPSAPNVAGTLESHRFVNAFVARSKRLWGTRRPLSNVGVLFSPTSQLAFMAPGGYPDMDRQPHPFSYYGWATALEELHIPHIPLPEFRVTPDVLRTLDVLILPHASVLPQAVVKNVLAWLRGGGILVVDGSTSALIRSRSSKPIDGAFGHILKIGRGRLVRVAGDPGLKFYTRRAERQHLLEPFRKLEAVVRNLGFQPPVETHDLPQTAGISVFSNPSSRAVFVDCYNTAYDPDRDAVRPCGPFRLRVRLPKYLSNSTVHGTLLTPGSPPREIPVRRTDKHAVISLPGLRYYASVCLTR
ncbi:MAG: hypothetical protein ACUVTZ_10795 [Armatimonadota bacterium]